MGGSGTTGFLPAFSSATALVNSVIQQAQPSGWSNISVGFNGLPGSTSTAPIGVDILGTVTEGSPNGYGATQLVVEGSLASSSSAQAYLRGMSISPSFNFGAGYGNYAEGAYIAAPNITTGYSNVVSSLELGQPASGTPGATSCSAALNISMPNQSGNCPAGGNRVWSIYNGSASSSFFAGNVGFGTAQPAYPIQAGGAYVTTGGVWTNASSRELKKDIRSLPAGEAMKALASLEPVTFRYKADGEAHVGFIAEDVPDLVAAADRKGLSAMDIVAVLTKVVQQQQTALSDQRRELDALKAQLAKGPRKR